jgi:hypothetical protein
MDLSTRRQEIARDLGVFLEGGPELLKLGSPGRIFSDPTEMRKAITIRR